MSMSITCDCPPQDIEYAFFNLFFCYIDCILFESLRHVDFNKKCCENHYNNNINQANLNLKKNIIIIP